MSGRRLLSVLAAALLAPCTIAIAQVDFGASYGISLGSDLTGGAMIGSAIPRAGSHGGRSPVGPVMGAEAERGVRERAASRRLGLLAAAPTTYRADPAVTERVKAQYVAFVAQRSPSDAALVRSDFTRFDPVQAWTRMVAENGLHPGDVADAFAGYWVLNWSIANGADATPRQTLAVREQMRPVIARHPRFTALSPAQRQEMAEALMLNFVYQRNGYMLAARRGDRALMARVQAAATARFRNEIGVDPHALALTDEGFVRR